MSMACNLPPEIVISILEKLPIKSIFRFTCVCKFWYFSIKDPNFMYARLKNNINNNHDKQLFVFNYFDGGQQKYSLYLDVEGELKEYLQLNAPFNSYGMGYNLIGSCNGVLCLADANNTDSVNSYILWNPAIGRVFEVPQFEDFRFYEFYSVTGFGFDYCNSDYKVLIFYKDIRSDSDYWSNKIEVRIFSVRKGCWNSSTSVLPVSLFNLAWHTPLVFVNGAVHCIACHGMGCSGSDNAILGFDVGEEVFHKFALPSCLEDACSYDLSVIVYKASSIAVVLNNGITDNLQIWVMRAYGFVETWTKLGNFEIGVSKVIGFRKNEKLLLQNWTGSKILSLDLKNEKRENHRIPNAEDCSLAPYVESLALLDIGNPSNSGNDPSKLKGSKERIRSGCI